MKRKGTKREEEKEDGGGEGKDPGGWSFLFLSPLVPKSLADLLEQ